MFVSSNPLFPHSMLGLCYDKLPKVVWWFFTTLKPGREGDEASVTSTISLRNWRFPRFVRAVARKTPTQMVIKKRHQLRMIDIMQLAT